MFELMLAASAAYFVNQLLRTEQLKSLDLRKRQAEIDALSPSKSDKRGWFVPKPPKPKTRADKVQDVELLLAEELEFCKKLTDSVARQAAEASAYVRFRERLMAIMDTTS